MRHTADKIQPETRTNAEEAECRKNLSTQQEEELVTYIQGLTSKGLPPTRSMLQNYACVVAKKEVEMSWISRFLDCNKDNLLPKWATGLDSDCFRADSYNKYKLYFDLLDEKMQEYEVEAGNMYNMNEKGFMLGTIRLSKRVFSRQSWETQSARQAVQDSSREWITVLRYCCADGSV
jgi:hypothetical protein